MRGTENGIVHRVLTHVVVVSSRDVELAPYAHALPYCCALLHHVLPLPSPQQAYPFVARKVLRDDGSGTAALLRDLVYDEGGRLRPGRLSALLQAALGYVSEQTEGFVDFDAVPAEGASASEILAFVLGPEAKELRPLLIGWLAGAADLVLRDRWVWQAGLWGQQGCV